MAVAVSKTHWLPTPKLFLKNGFELADQAAPSFDLLVKRFRPEAPLPRFKHPVKKAPNGLTLYHSDQCPYLQNLPDITMKVGEQIENSGEYHPPRQRQGGSAFSLSLRNAGIFL